MKIDFAGFGIMGSTMAANLIKSGLNVTISNRSADKCAHMADIGAAVVGSARMLAERCDIIRM